MPTSLPAAHTLLELDINKNMETTFHINKSFYSRAALVSGLIVAVSVLILVLTGNPDTNGKSAVYMVVCILGSSSLLGFIYVLYVLLDRTVPLTINAGGLLDQTRGSGAGSISWHNIHSIKGFQQGKYKFLSLGITDVRPIVEQVDVAQRMAFERRLERNKDHINIMLNQLKGDPDEIFETVKQKWKEATGRTDD